MIRKEIANSIAKKLPKEVRYYRCKQCFRITYSNFDSVDCIFCGRHMESINRETAISDLQSGKYGGI